MSKRILTVGLAYTGPSTPGAVIEARGLCRPESFQLQAAAPLYEYDVVIIWPQSYSHIMFGEASQYSNNDSELWELKRDDNGKDIDNAFWRHDREQELEAAIQAGTHIICIATPDKITKFFGTKSLYGGYVSRVVEKVLTTSSLFEKSSTRLSMEPTITPFTPYFETLKRWGWNLCWVPGSVRDVEQVTLASTPEGYVLGSRITANNNVIWLLTPPPTAESVTALVRCSLELKKNLVQSSRYHGIFLSHNSEDKVFVRKLRDALIDHGVDNVWVDEAEIMIGDSLIRKIREGIEHTDYFGIVLSPRSIRSEWVQRELEQAMTMEINSRTVRVLPLMYEPCDLPGFLNGKLYADFTAEGSFNDSLKKLLRRLEKARA